MLAIKSGHHRFLISFLGVRDYLPNDWVCRDLVSSVTAVKKPLRLSMTGEK